MQEVNLGHRSGEEKEPGPVLIGSEFSEVQGVREDDSRKIPYPTSAKSVNGRQNEAYTHDSRVENL